VNTIPLSPEFMRGLREAEATYRYLVEGIPAILYIDAVDDLSSTLYTSPQLKEILGFTPEEWREDPGLWLARVHEDDRERVSAEVRRTNQLGEPFRAEYRMIAADGREVWIRDESVLVRNEEGDPLFWRGIMFDVTEQKHTEEKLKLSLEILRRTMHERSLLLARLEQAQEEERRRIAADIHDDSIQVIGAADLRLQALRKMVKDDDLRGEVSEIHETLQLAIERLRHLLFELRPPLLDQGLVSALRQYLEEADPRLELSLEDRLEAEPPTELRATLFRIAQEAMTNVRKHAGAARLDVLVASEDGGIRLRIADDGRGFDTAILSSPAHGHIGLPTIIERAELMGGWCRVDSAPGAGATVACWIPLPGQGRSSGAQRTA